MVIAQALFARERGKGGSHVRTSLAMGTQLVQFPFMARHAQTRTDVPSGQTARGDGSDQHLYKLADCWAYVGCRPGDSSKVADAVGSSSDSMEAIGENLHALTLAQLQERLAAVPGASAVAIQSLAQLRASYTVESETAGSDAFPAGSFRLRRGAHPSGHPTTVPLATWIRPSSSPVTPLYPAPIPGSDTVAVLGEAGFSDKEIGTLLRNGCAHADWNLLKRYLPH